MKRFQEEMPDVCDIQMYNTLLRAAVSQKHLNRVPSVLRSLEQDGNRKDIHTYTALVGIYHRVARVFLAWA